MKKASIFIAVLMLGSMVASAGVEPKITILQPVPGTYYRCDSLKISWSHSAYFDPYHQTCVIFCGSEIISPPVQVKADSFMWEVGKKADGTYLAPGSYHITLESPDYDCLDGPTITIAEAGPKITIISPSDGAILTMGSQFIIRWNSSAYYKCWAQKGEIFCGETVISPEVLVKDGQFEWTVGTKVSGVDIGPGTHQITLESPDYDCLNGPDVTLVFPSYPPFKLFIKKIPLFEVPGYPMHFRINPSDLKFDPSGLKEPVRIVIARGRRIFARLGEFGAKLALPGPVTVQLDNDVLRFIQSGRPGFKLQVIGPGGKILEQHPVQLEIAK